jgi:hypothetical protein
MAAYMMQKSQRWMGDWQLHRRHTHLPKLQTAQDRRSVASIQPITVCGSMFNFSEVEPKEDGRRNRGRMKRDASSVRDLVSGMCSMTEKQLKAVAAAVCGDVIADAVRLASRLPRSNQVSCGSLPAGERAGMTGCFHVP